MKNTNTTEKQPSKYLRKIMNKSKENRKKGLASPIFNTISDMKKWYDNQDDTTEKQETMERFREIGLESAYRLDRLFYSDKSGMQVIEDFIQSAVEKAYQDGYEKGHEAACEFYRSERDILLKDKEKARIEVAEEIFNEFDTRLKKDHDVVDIYLLAGLKAKYLSPTQEKDQNKINTGSIDTEDKSKERK